MTALTDIPDSEIANILSSQFSDMEKNDISALFKEKAKITLDAKKKEGKAEVAALLKNEAQAGKGGPFTINKFKGVDVDKTSKIYSGIVNWCNKNYMITVCIEPEDAENVLISNIILLQLKD